VPSASSVVTTGIPRACLASPPVAFALLREYVVGDDCVHHLSSSVVTGRLFTAAVVTAQLIPDGTVVLLDIELEL